MTEKVKPVREVDYAVSLNLEDLRTRLELLEDKQSKQRQIFVRIKRSSDVSGYKVRVVRRGVISALRGVGPQPTMVVAGKLSEVSSNQTQVQLRAHVQRADFILALLLFLMFNILTLMALNTDPIFAVIFLISLNLFAYVYVRQVNAFLSVFLLSIFDAISTEDMVVYRSTPFIETP